MRWVKGFGLFWYDFIVGDDWYLALGAVIALVAGALLTSNGMDYGWIALPLIVILTLIASLHRAVSTTR